VSLSIVTRFTSPSTVTLLTWTVSGAAFSAWVVLKGSAKSSDRRQAHFIMASILHLLPIGCLEIPDICNTKTLAVGSISDI